MELNELETYRSWWKKQSSSIPGFTRSFIARTPAGDVLEADFNFHERLVRLSVEIADENGKNYAATVQNGSILKEKDVTGGRNYPISRKILPFRDVFSCIPDPDLLEALGGVYEISLYPLGQRERRLGRGVYEKVEIPLNSEEDSPYQGKYDAIFGIVRETWFQRWRRTRRKKRLRREPFWHRFWRRFWGETFDFCIGFGLAVLVYNYWYDYVILGFTVGGFGFLAGGIDWAFRKRDPLLIKVLSFLSIGSYFFYQGYTQF